MKNTILISLTPFSMAAAHAAQWHASPTGADANPGTSAERPFRTVQKAESVVEPGGVVLLAGGIYRADEDADKSDNSALLKGASRAVRMPGSRGRRAPATWAAP